MDALSVCLGGANGIGKALAIQLSNLGAKYIVLADVDMAAANQVAKSITSDTNTATIVTCIRTDVSSEGDIRRLVTRVEAEIAPIDAFFANAGILSLGGIDVANEEWDAVWKINVMQIIYVARHLMPRYEKRQKGVMVITASAAGLLNFPGALPYGVTKSATVAAAEWLAFTMKSKFPQVQVSCLCPQAVKTDMIGDSDGGPAGHDGVLEPIDVAKVTIESVQRGQFMILPHQIVKQHMMGKAKYYDKWIGAMSKISKTIEEQGVIPPPPRQLSKL